MNKVRIFIVDDHRMFRQGLTELLLKKSGFNVVGEAADGREAIGKLARAKPDIVLLDISMPEMDGLTAIGQIRKRAPSAKIIILSMHDRSSYICSALSLGASGYLLKDVDAEELFQAIDAVLGGETYLSKRVNQSVIREYIDQSKDRGFLSPMQTLTNREREVFQLMVEGHTGKAMAQKLNVAYKTVEHHRSKVMEKLECSNIAELIHMAAREGLLHL